MLGALAYVDAVQELKDRPSIVVVASGTGATQAGISAGLKFRDWNTEVIGISVARDAIRGLPEILKIYEPLCAQLGIQSKERDITFHSEYRCDGYGIFDSKIMDTIKLAAVKDSLPLDPIYTGKAFFGLRKLTVSGRIPKGAKVLFWHTGGNLNLQSSLRISK